MSRRGLRTEAEMTERPPDSDENSAPEPEAERRHWPSPRIYVASLSDYNNGILHGAWIEAAQDAEDIKAAVDEMLRSSSSPGAEEWAIHDYEGFGALQLSEYDSFESVARVAEGIAKHGPAFAAWASLVGIDSDRLDDFADCYVGEWQNGAAWVEESLEDLDVLDPALDQLPAHMRPYLHFDYEGYFKDLMTEGSIDAVERPEGGYFVFWN